jgi:metal-responsive CopG/Arc/MetJ family transcriptional regulator
MIKSTNQLPKTNMETVFNAEITIRLEGEVLTAIDAVAQNTGLSSRSAAIEKILRRWYEVAWLQQELDRETEVYYKSLTPEEIAEDRAWVQFASEQAMHRWDDR